jgi:hypothetical protein
MTLTKGFLMEGGIDRKNAVVPPVSNARAGTMF